MKILINSLLFNIAWFGCILMGNAFIPLVLTWLFFHLRQSPSRGAEILFIISMALIGSLVDSTLIRFGVFIFADDSLWIPMWLMFIWLSFSLTINGYLACLQKHIGFQLLVGMFLAPLSYIGGNKLGSVEFAHSMVLTFVILSVIWSLLMPFFYFLNQFIRENFYVQKI